jgi:hypothetical protein
MCELTERFGGSRVEALQARSQDLFGQLPIDGDDLEHEANPPYRDSWDGVVNRHHPTTPQPGRAALARGSQTSIGADRGLHDAARPTRAVARPPAGGALLGAARPTDSPRTARDTPPPNVADQQRATSDFRTIFRDHDRRASSQP